MKCERPSGGGAMNEDTLVKPVSNLADYRPPFKGFLTSECCEYCRYWWRVRPGNAVGVCKYPSQHNSSSLEEVLTRAVNICNLYEGVT